MITFTLSLVALVLGYFLYGRVVERVFGPDDRVTLWTITVYLVRQKKCYWITLIPALFMTTVCSTYFFVSKQMLQLGGVGYALGIACLVVACVWFVAWYRKETKNKLFINI